MLDEQLLHESIRLTVEIVVVALALLPDLCETFEPELPADWMQYVAVEDVFVGKQVAQLLGLDLAGYTATPDGWLREESPGRAGSNLVPGIAK